MTRRRDKAPIEAPADGRQQGLGRQVSTLTRRQIRVLLADPTRATFTALLPFALAVLALVVPGEQGLGPPGAGAEPTGQPTQILLVLVLGAVFAGLAAAIGDLVGERAIYLRERAVGLDPAAYVLSKLVVLGTLTLGQCVILVTVILTVRTGPQGGALVGWSALELVVALWLCALACVALGLWVSATVGRVEQMMPLLVVLVMVQLVLSGGLFPVDGRVPLEQIAWLSPSRWGYAAVAATADVNSFVPHADDPLWRQSAGSWLRAMLFMVLLAAAFAGLALRRLSRRYRSQRR